MVRLRGLGMVGAGIILAWGIAALGRPVYAPGYAEMMEKSDLVVIATPIGRKELAERTVMPGVRRGNDEIAAIQVETTFRVEAVVKGKLDGEGKEMVLLHLIEANPPAEPGPNDAGAGGFSGRVCAEYLMFLKRREDKRYEAMNGQTDPAFSIRVLEREGEAAATRP